MAITHEARIARREPPRGTAAGRSEWGRTIRTSTPRAALAHWVPPSDRADPIEILLAQDVGRIPELIPVRFGRMIASPLAFFRGGAAVMAADLATMPTTGIFTQACGDAHLMNFGVFATPERRLSFDLNDFDETHPAPFEWDVLRLVASIEVATRELGLGALGQEAAGIAARRYCETVTELAALPYFDAWHSRMDVEAILERLAAEGAKREVRETEKLVARAQTRTHLGALAKYAERTESGWRIREAPPLVVRVDPEQRTPGGTEVGQIVKTAYKRYLASLRPDLRVFLSQYTLTDMARKVVGIGSVATGSFMMLLIGPQGDDPLFLQLKEAGASVLEPYTGRESSASHGHHGERVVTGQRLLQAASDELLGWLRVDDLNRSLDLYVRQLRDGKLSVDLGSLRADGFRYYAGGCGEALARAHARVGQAPEIAGYVGKGTRFDKAVVSFAAAYADQTIADHQALLDAEAAGRITATRGV